MNNKTKLFAFIFYLVITSNLTAQIGGNQVYEEALKIANENSGTKSIYSTDSTLIVTTKVILNKAPKFYVITVGVNSMEKTVIKANQLTNTKIENVIENIKELGISESDIYVDFISETKMYDRTVTGKTIEEYFDGISIRKNLIIKTNNLSNIDKIIGYCSEQEIYDIVKVDYVSEDFENFNSDLFNEALEISKTKIKRFFDHSSIELTNNYRIVSESFKIFYPKNLYKKYDEAHETSFAYSDRYSNYLHKEVRKERTFYYDGVETRIGADKVIDEISPVIGIQYILELVVLYNLPRLREKTNNEIENGEIKPNNRKKRRNQLNLIE